MSAVHIEISTEQLRDFCERHAIQELSLFGSVVRDDFTPESDVDVLVKFAPEKRIGLFGLAEIEAELSDLLGRKVDLNTAGSLSRYFRDEVLAEAVTLYVVA